jgi:hypothetical protein
VATAAAATAAAASADAVASPTTTRASLLSDSSAQRITFVVIYSFPYILIVFFFV